MMENLTECKLEPQIESAQVPEMVSDVLEIGETEINGLEQFKSPEGQVLEPEVRYDVPNCNEALVTGHPFDTAELMVVQQGNNPFRATGNCGLVSICNTLRRAGMDVTETDVTQVAIENGLCYYDPNGPTGENGGTTPEMQKKVLAQFGVDSEVGLAIRNGTWKDIAEAIDSGKGVLINICADLLWDEDMGGIGFFGPMPNHCVSVTGVARDAATGEIVGFYIADSGRGLQSDASRYLTMEEFHKVYTDVWNACAVITT